MPLFGRSNDRKLIKHFNKEVLEDILDTRVTIFKPFINRTDANLYGEGPDGYKEWRNGITIYATILTDDQEWESTDFGLDVNQNITFSFLNEHIWAVNSSGTNEEKGFAIDPGDIVFFDSHYWEIDSTVRNQYLFGRNQNISDPHGAYNISEGESLSTIAKAHLTRRSKINIDSPNKETSTGTTGTTEGGQTLYR